MYIGDPRCKYNALNPSLRCSINPCGPCKRCPSFFASGAMG
jgi:hypothetical protein